MTFSRYNLGLFNSGTYAPYVVDIESIAMGVSTTVTTEEAHGYQVGNLVQFRIPNAWGMQQLNNRKGYVIEVPDELQLIVDIDSSSFNEFVTPTPPPFVVIDPAQVVPAGDANFNQAFPANNPRLPRTIQGAYANQPP